MSIKRIIRIMCNFLFMILIISCGSQNQKQSSVTGTVEVGGEVQVLGPVFLIITKTDDFALLEKDPAGNLITLVNVDENGNFKVDFTEFGVSPGDKIYLIGFVDNDYNGSIPMPTFGDYVGFYIDLETMNTAYEVKEGSNEVNIRINRRVYDFESELQGALLHDAPGEWKLIAYSGEVDLSLTSIDIDHVIGFTKLNKQEGSCDYSLKIMPYIRYVPILHVYVFAFLDKNGNSKVDGGDLIGYHKGDNGLPKPLKINEGVFDGIDINSFKNVNDPSGYNISVKGNFTSPQGYTSFSSPIFIMVAQADKVEDIMSNPMDSIKTYEKIEPGRIDFDIDLSKTDLMPGDEIMVIALWDKDYFGTFPEVTPGDYIGYYMNTVTMDYSVELVQGVNYVVPSGDWTFNIDKEIFDHNSSVEGIIADDEAGEFILIAYAGEIASLNMSDINTDDVIAYKNIAKGVGSQSYKLDIMPYGKDLPIEDVYIFGFLDRNGNGKPDHGDKYGYYGFNGLPDTITIVDDTISGIDISNFKEIFDFNARVEGNILGDETGNIILVAYAGDITSMDMSTFNTDDIIGYKKIEKSGSLCEYSLPILPYGKNIPIEDVYIIAILDLNNNGTPDVGDKIGFYQDAEGYPETVTIYDEVLSGIDIEFSMDITPDSSISVQGYFNKPVDYNETSPPIFVMIAVTDNMQDLVDRPMEVVKSYQKVNPGENTFNITFKEDDINPGDNIIVIGLWDKDYVSGVPEITVGDDIGFYFNTSKFQFTFPVVDGINLVVPEGDWTFDINKPYTGASATVQGRICEYQKGDVIVVGLVGDLTSLDMSAINIDNIVAYKKFSKPLQFYNYSVNVFPFGHYVPIENVQMIAFMDKNGNGVPDESDLIGFHRNESNDHMPKTINILEGDNSDIDIWLTKKIYNYHTSINYTLNPGNHPEDLQPGDKLIHVVIHTNGVTNNYTKVNFDYVLGMKTIPYSDDPNYIYSFNLMNYIDIDVGNLYSGRKMNVYVLAIFDRNGDGKPSPGEDIACYPDGHIWLGKMVYYPKKFYLEIDTSNWLGDPEWIGFIGKKI